MGKDDVVAWWVIGAVYVVVVLAAIALVVIGDTDATQTRSGWWIGMGILGFAVVAQFILVGTALWNRLKRVTGFYDKLADARLKEWEENRDYVESYRHLREHGNAKSILLCEIALGFILSIARTKTEFVVFLALWILPATSSWIIGTVLENRLAHNAHKEAKAKVDSNTTV